MAFVSYILNFSDAAQIKYSAVGDVWTDKQFRHFPAKTIHTDVTPLAYFQMVLTAVIITSVIPILCHNIFCVHLVAISIHKLLRVSWVHVDKIGCYECV